MKKKFPRHIPIFFLCLIAEQAIATDPPFDGRTTSAALQTAANAANRGPANKNQPSKPMQTAREVLDKYLELSANGAWLSYDGRIQIGRLTEWTPNEQHLMSIQVISSYRVAHVSSVGDTVEVFVDFDVVGWLVEEFYKFEVERKIVRVVFRMRKRDRNWIIVAPDYPAIYWKEVVRYLETIAPNMANPDYFRNLAKVITDSARKGP